MADPFFFESTVYWSDGDERAHFDWLGRIASVRSVRGEADRLYLDVDPVAVTADDLRELQAVYRRYDGDLEQLVSLQ